jgi:hypothetical protein
MAKVNIYFVLASCSVVFLIAFLYTQYDILAISQSYLQRYRDEQQPLPSHPTPLSDEDYERLAKAVQNQTEASGHKDLWTPEFTEVLGGADGVILSNKQTNISSPNGIYTLSLTPNANLVLSRAGGVDVNRDLWWTGGGRLGREEWNIVNEVKIDMTGNLTVQRTSFPEENTKINWHSNLLSQCAEPGIDEWRMKLATGQRPALRLYNSGELSIAGRCTIYKPLSHDTRSDLALIVSGLLRTLNTTCHQHVEKIAQHPRFKSADVFVYALYEKENLANGMTVEKIESDIRMCYGRHLQTINLLPVEAVTESFSGKINPHCGDKLHRLQSQLKTLFLSGQAWQNWTIQTGKMHDMVMRIRTDNNFWGEEHLGIESVADLGQNTLVVPHLMADRLDQFYCPSPDGHYHIGTGDQIAYGSPTAISAFLRMYYDFPLIVEQATPDSGAHHNFFGCSSLPTGPRYEDCKGKSDCSIECMVSWYLRLRGIQVRPEWSWKTGMLRPS